MTGYADRATISNWQTLEPAQVAAYKAGLNPEIINLLSGPRLRNAEGSMSIICKLLRLVANQGMSFPHLHFGMQLNRSQRTRG